MEVQSTLAAVDSTCSCRNDVEQFRGSGQIERTLADIAALERTSHVALASQMLAPGQRSWSDREARIKMKPTVLVVTTDR
jgi:hypothetical protein